MKTDMLEEVSVNSPYVESAESDVIVITIIIISSFIIEVVVRNFHTQVLRYIAVTTHRRKFNSRIQSRTAKTVNCCNYSYFV